jgi:hypothetical protein
MLKSWKVKLGLVVLSLVCWSGLSGLVAAQTCPPTFSNLPDHWQYPPDWCGEISISSPATVNPGTDWNGTISPADLDTTCSVSSNSGCSLGCYVSADGSEVIVPVGPNHCGSFTVTITQPASGGCPEGSATKAVRIKNTGQGGAWELIYQCNGNCSGPDTRGCYNTNTVGTVIDDNGYAWWWTNCKCFLNPPGTQCDTDFANGICSSGWGSPCPPSGWEGLRDYFCCGDIRKYEWKCNICQ